MVRQQGGTYVQKGSWHWIRLCVKVRERDQDEKMKAGVNPWKSHTMSSYVV